MFLFYKTIFLNNESFYQLFSFSMSPCTKSCFIHFFITLFEKILYCFSINAWQLHSFNIYLWVFLCISIVLEFSFLYYYAYKLMYFTKFINITKYLAYVRTYQIETLLSLKLQHVPICYIILSTWLKQSRIMLEVL